MRKERTINVGIKSADSIDVIFTGEYLCKGIQCTGEYCFGHDLSEELLFTPTYKECFFTLKDVTIGIDFHWQMDENQSFKGALKLFVKKGILIAVNIIGIEDYLTSVISSEMSATAPFEFLKAHAVISRSWVIRQLERKIEAGRGEGMKDTPEELVRWQESEDHIYFDVCADDHCQRYQGITKAFTPEVRKAVESTWGEVITYDGKVCDARFSKCCGGQTEEFSACWENIDVPYLKSVKDPFCGEATEEVLKKVLPSFDQKTTDYLDWEVSYTADEISKLVAKRTGTDFGTILDLIPLDRGASGRIYRLKIVGTKRTRIIGKELEIRKTLSKSHLNSSAFEVEKLFDGFRLKGKGWGHGVGLCQIGAAVMGEKGYSYDAILKHYYKGVTIQRLYDRD
ncbi:MAG: SpoIID/LytB domain-containing protein [Bacteroidales bacterium]|nr:SpoIID/LytB domain-containing protein [Bacteroidales bacterium]